ncbi:MAG: CDP-alcohol phosphatidyltransferase family protein [Planctomycetota bacterium]
MNDEAVEAPSPVLRVAPNALSGCRLGLAFALPFVDERWWLGMVLAAGASDWLDGFLARRWGAASWWGGILDGLADKLFVFSSLTSLAVHHLLPAWWVPILLARDLAVAAGMTIGLFRRNRRALQDVGSRPCGRLTTILVFGLLVTTLAWPDLRRAHQALFLLAAAASVGAAVDYAQARMRALAAR